MYKHIPDNGKDIMEVSVPGKQQLFVLWGDGWGTTYHYNAYGEISLIRYTPPNVVQQRAAVR